MDAHVVRGDPDRRWWLLSHILFAVALGVPTVVAVVEQPAGLPATLLLAAAFVLWYLLVVGGDPAWQHRTGRALLYATGALAFHTVLVVRFDPYFLLLYALLPQFFSMLPRVAAIVGVVGIVLLPAAVTGGLGDLLDDPSGLFNLLAAVGLGLAMTAFIQALGKRTSEQQEMIAALEEARAENERLLDRTRRDLRDRDALAWVGHALVAARSADEVAAALAEHLARHSAQVRGVALLARRTEQTAEVVVTVPGTASPAVGDVVAVPHRPSDDAVHLLPVHDLPPDQRARMAGVTAAAVLPLHPPGSGPVAGSSGNPAADLVWIGVAGSDAEEAALLDLSTVTTQTAFALTNLHLAAHAAQQGRTAGVLAERQRLAHEIHDTLAQGFTSIVTQLEAAEQALDRDRTVAASHVERAKRTARDSLGEARRTVAALRPGPLEHAGLPEAVQKLAASWRDHQASPPDVDVSIDGAPAPADAGAEAAMLRVLQESLHNIGRHARAGHVRVTLSYLDDLLLLDVQDDGVGFDNADRPVNGGDVTRGGYGLIAMRERMEQMGGRLVVESVPGEGTSVAGSVPLRPAPGRALSTSSGAAG